MKIIIALILAAALGGIAALDYNEVETKTLHVLNKESVAKSADQGGGHEYRVYAEEDTYVIKDSLLHTRFDSSRLYGRLTPGTYNCKVYGWRIPLFSRFKNILDCAPLRPSEVR